MSEKKPDYRFLVINTNKFYVKIGKKLFEAIPLNEFKSRTEQGNKPNLVLEGSKEILDEAIKKKILEAETGKDLEEF